MATASEATTGGKTGAAKRRRSRTSRAAKDKDKNKTEETPNPAVDAAAEGAGLDITATPDEAALDEAATSGAEAGAAAAIAEGADDDGDLMGVSTTEVQEVAPQVEDEPPAEEPQAQAEMSQEMRDKVSPQSIPDAPKSKAEQRAEKRAEQERKKAAEATASPSAKRLGPIGKKLPGAEHIKVHRRGSDGRRTFVNDYSIADLAASQDIESFLNLYVKPTFGPGIYEITGVDAKGGVMDMGSVQLAGAPAEEKSTGGLSAMDLLHTMLQEQLKGNNRPPPRPAPAPPQENPIDQMRKLHELRKEMEGEPNTGGDATAAAIRMLGQSQSSSMELLLAMMQKSDERFMQMMQMMQPQQQQQGADPMVLVLLKALIEDKSGSNSAPLPPPVAPPSPLEGIKEVVELVKAMQPQQNDSDSLTKLLLAERMTPKDTIEMVKSLSGDRGTDDFRKTAENITAMHNLMGMMGGGGGGGWSEFFNSPLASSIANGINNKLAMQRQRAAGQQPMNAATELQARAQQLQERKLAIAERELAQREAQLGLGPGAEAAELDPEQSVDMSPQQQQAVQRVRSVNQGKLPPLPADISQYANALVLAEEDGDLVGGVINLVEYLTTQDYWDRLGNAILQTIHAGEQEVALRYIEALFDGLVQIQIVTTELRNRIVEVVMEHWETIHSHVVESFEDASQLDPEAAVAAAFGEDEDDEDDDETLDTSGLGLDDDDDDDGGLPN